MASRFVDRAVIHLTAGDGGNGCASVHREKFKPLGGPDGGNGGNGGDVLLVVDPNVHTLLDFHFRPHAKAGNGKMGQGGNRAGAAGETLTMKVPSGTVVFTEDGELVADLIGPGTTFVAARQAPPNESDNATGGTTESGISDSHGLVFTGTPTAAGLDKRVSVSVDLSITGADHTDLVFTATEVLTGPGTAEEPVPDDKKAAVFRAFSTTMPGMKLPFGLAPTSEGARGSDVIIEGIASGVTVPMDGFSQS